MGILSNMGSWCLSSSLLIIVLCVIYYYSRAMAQAVSRWPLIAEAWVRAQVNTCGICGGQSGTGTGFSPSSSVFPVNIIPPLLHIHWSSPHEVCDSSDQAAYYHALDPKRLRLWPATWTKEEERSIFIIIIIVKIITVTEKSKCFKVIRGRNVNH
jgi:hypothetical protein